MIVHVQQKCLTDCGCFLTDGKVSRTFVIVLDPLIGALRLDTLKHAFEFSYQEHILVHPDQGVGSIGLLFLGQILLVLIKGNFGKWNASGFAFFRRFYDL